MEKIFTDEFLEEIGFERVELPPSEFNKNNQYGRAIDKRTKGMTVLSWNNEGASCTYFREKLEPNVYLGIGKDGDTRKAFNGYVFNQDDVKRLLTLTW
jgi:hypothetical protein